MEIRNGRRNGVDRRAEGERKTHERAVNIEAWQLIATAIDAVDARGIHDQRHQAVGDLEDDLDAFLNNHRQVTNELDAVAKPLLRVQQDGLPDQRFAAPLWLREFARLQFSFAPPAPLIAGPAARKITDGKAQQAFVPVRFGEIGSERDGPIEALDRLLGPIEVAQRVASIDPGIDIIGRCLERPVIIGKRVGRAVELDQRVAAIVIALVVIGLECEGTIAHVQRLAVPAHFAQRVAAIAMRLGEIRPDGHSTVVVRKRCGKGFHRIMGVAAADQQCGVVRFDRQRAVVARE